MIAIALDFEGCWKHQARTADDQEGCAAEEEGGLFEVLPKRTQRLQSWLDPGDRKEDDELEETAEEEAEVQYEAKPKAASHSHIAVRD